MKKREKKQQEDIVEKIICDISSQNDPMGSWTGRPTDDAYQVPVQDADDL